MKQDKQSVWKKLGDYFTGHKEKQSLDEAISSYMSFSIWHFLFASMPKSTAEMEASLVASTRMLADASTFQSTLLKQYAIVTKLWQDLEHFFDKSKIREDNKTQVFYSPPPSRNFSNSRFPFFSLTALRIRYFLQMTFKFVSFRTKYFHSFSSICRCMSEHTLN